MGKVSVRRECGKGESGVSVGRVSVRRVSVGKGECMVSIVKVLGVGRCDSWESEEGEVLRE